YATDNSGAHNKLLSMRCNSIGPLLGGNLGVDLTYVDGFTDFCDWQGPDVTYGITATYVTDLKIFGLDWSQAYADRYSFGNNQLTLINSGPGEISGMNFNSATGSPVSFQGGNSGIDFHDNTCSAPTTEPCIVVQSSVVQ